MIEGEVDARGIPIIQLKIGKRTWTAIVDTGFSGDLELPDDLKSEVDPQFIGEVRSFLGGGQVIVEDSFEVRLSFDGRIVSAEATFVPGFEILLGTRFLRRYRLEIDFPKGTVSLKRSR